MNKIVSLLYKIARIANDLNTLLSADPTKIMRRAKNKILGRKIIRKVWRFPF